MTQRSSNRLRRRLTMAAMSIVSLLLPVGTVVRAADQGWICGSGNWSSVSCWSLGSLPAAEDAVFLTSVDGLSRTVTLDVSLPPVSTVNGFLGSLSVDAMGGGVMTFRQGDDFDFSAGFQYVGVVGTATFEHVSGRNDVLTSPGGIIYDITDLIQGGLYLGVQSTGTGTYMLSGTGTLSSNASIIGYRGTGSFVQSGGSHATAEGMTLGYEVGSNGSYLLSDGVLASTGTHVGHEGVGTFVQTGGWHGTSTGWLGVGDPSGASSYALSGGELHSSTTAIGSGVFTQTGGIHAVADVVWIASSLADSTSEYRMQGGNLSADGSILVGSGGSGSFNHSEGDVVANWLGLADINESDEGTYELSGSGSLSAMGEFIGVVGHGVFNQSGGVNTVSHSLTLGTSYQASGTYNLERGHPQHQTR